MTEVVRDRETLFSRCEGFRRAGERVGFVPTMGALHAGHLSLIDAVRARGATRTVLSIFVNPTQFGPQEDFGRYPRTLERDLEACASRGVDLVYAPDTDEVYPPGFQTFVDLDTLTKRWEGGHRPGHFRGVATVVTKLLVAVGPCLAGFGRKDYQQWKVIEALVRDLGLPVQILGCPIHREPDGLAMSSRNRYLDTALRNRALAIPEGLRRAHDAFARGERDAETLVEHVLAPIRQRFDHVDYVACVDPDILEPIVGVAGDRALLLVAARLSSDAPAAAPTTTAPTAAPTTVRLIDNILLGQDPRP